MKRKFSQDSLFFTYDNIIMIPGCIYDVGLGILSYISRIVYCSVTLILGAEDRNPFSLKS